MTVQSRLALFACLLAFLSAPRVFAEPPAEPPTPNRIDAAILELRSPEYLRRQQASRSLLDAGEQAVQALGAAAESDDLESATRCVEILAKFAQSDKSEAALKTLEKLAAAPSLRVSSRASRIVTVLKTSEHDRAVMALESAGARLGRNPANNDVLWVHISADYQAQYLRYLPKLQMVQLNGVGVTNQCLDFLADADQVSSILLMSTSVDADGLGKLKELEKLSQFNCFQQPFTGRDLAQLADVPNLRSLSLRGSPIDDDYEFLAKLPKLQTVSLAKLTLGSDEVEQLNKLNKLSMLQLQLSDADDEQLDWLSKIKASVHLQLTSSKRLTTAGWRSLSKANLNGLYTFMTPMTDEHLKYVGKITSLRTLGIYNAPITNDGLKHLKNLKSLTSINLRDTKVSDEALVKFKSSLPRFQGRQLIASGLRITRRKDGLNDVEVRGNLNTKLANDLKKVEKLNHVQLSTFTKNAELAMLKEIPLKGLSIRSKSITDKGVASLASHATLQTLRVKAANISDNALESVAKIPTLRRVSFEGTRFTNRGMKRFISELSQSGSVQEFSLISCQQITNDGLADIANLKTLRALNLGGNAQLTTKLLSQIRKLKQLQRLVLDEIQLAEEDLELLAELPKLEILGLAYADKSKRLSPSAVAKLRELKSLKTLRLDAKQTLPDIDFD